MEVEPIKIGFIGTDHIGASLALAIKDYPNSLLLLNNIKNNEIIPPLNRTVAKAENLHKKIKNSEVLSFK